MQPGRAKRLRQPKRQPGISNCGDEHSGPIVQQQRRSWGSLFVSYQSQRGLFLHTRSDSLSRHQQGTDQSLRRTEDAVDPSTQSPGYLRHFHS